MSQAFRNYGRARCAVRQLPEAALEPAHTFAMALQFWCRGKPTHRKIPPHLLEAALKGGVLLHVLAVLVQGGGADQAQLQ